MTDEQFLQAVKQTVLSFDPGAEVWLFGSRARGDARPDSDWDFLVLTDKPVDWQFKHNLRGELYDVGLDAGNSISTIIQYKQHMPMLSVTELYQNVTSEGRHL